MEMNTMKRLDWLDALKGLGIAFIVMGHIVGAWCHLGIGISSQVAMLAYKYFYAFHVPLFFVIAGMTFKQRPWGTFLKGLWQRLCVPYFIFGVLSILLYWTLYSIIVPIVLSHDAAGFYANKTEVQTLGEQLLLLVRGGAGAGSFVANSVLWFIPALVTVMVFARVVIPWVKQRWGWLIVVGVSLLASCFTPWNDFAWLPWGIYLIPKYLPFLALGCWLGTTTEVFASKWQRGIVSMGLIAVFGVIAIWNPWQYYPKVLWQHLFNFVVTGGNILGWVLLSQTFNLSAVVRYWGRQSMGIMLMHKFPVLFVQHFIPMTRALFVGSLIIGMGGCFLVFVIAMAMTCAACWVIGRFAPWMLGEWNHK